jgi:hypothetical protein
VPALIPISSFTAFTIPPTRTAPSMHESDDLSPAAPENTDTEKVAEKNALGDIYILSGLG